MPSLKSPPVIKSELFWTKGREDCLHPEWWHASDDESAEHEVTELVAAFVRAIQPDLVLETGCAFGQTTVAIGNALLANGHGQCVTLDLDSDRCDHTRLRCKGLPVDVVCTDALTFVSDRPIQFMWSDTYLGRAEEIMAVHAALTMGAIVGVHDTGPQHKVRATLVPLIDSGRFRAIFLPTPRGVCFMEKTG